MRFVWFRRGMVCALLASFLLLFVLPGFLHATGGSSSENDAIEHVSIEGKTGLYLFLVNVHNDHRLAFALMVTGTMVILGLALAEKIGMTVVGKVRADSCRVYTHPQRIAWEEA